MDDPHCTGHLTTTSQHFPPFSTWISPNNFGDFHPNPLMSLFTGNGQIEYPVERGRAISRIYRIVNEHDRMETPITFLVTGL